MINLNVFFALWYNAIMIAIITLHSNRLFNLWRNSNAGFGLQIAIYCNSNRILSSPDYFTCSLEIQLFFLYLRRFLGDDDYRFCNIFQLLLDGYILDYPVGFSGSPLLWLLKSPKLTTRQEKSCPFFQCFSWFFAVAESASFILL